MNTISQNPKSEDYYFSFLKRLKHDSKLDLISKLSESLKENTSKKKKTLKSLFGAYKSKDTAEDIIEDIKMSRSFNRKVEAF